MDRLSCLPDEVLCHILSFLPTKCSVQTSVLSKRWCFLWSHVPSLEFQLSEYAEESINSNIISKIVLQHNHDIHTFILSLANGDLDASKEEFESWIVNITTRNIRNLEIDLRIQFSLPQCIFTCKTLVYLSLCYSDYIPMSGICLPVLKKLQLTRVGYESDESLSHLISACPMLQELSIYGGVLGHFCVSSPTLTRLDLTLDNDFYDDFSDFEVKLDTPALRFLRLHCSMPNEFFVGALDSLIEADITLLWEKYHQDNFIYSRNVLAFVRQLRNAKLFKLSTCRIGVIHDTLFSSFTVKFHNLTKLDLHVYFNLGFVTSFLENADNLRILCLQIQNMDGIGDQYYWMEPERVPKCLISHLRKVNIYNFGRCKHEFDMVRYILKNAKVLKRMKIRNHQDLKKKFKAVKMIELFERSKKCRLVFD